MLTCSSPGCSGFIEVFEADPDKFRALNPANGWGDYDGFLTALHDIRRWLTGRIADNLDLDWWL